MQASCTNVAHPFNIPGMSSPAVASPAPSSACASPRPGVGDLLATLDAVLRAWPPAPVTPGVSATTSVGHDADPEAGLLDEARRARELLRGKLAREITSGCRSPWLVTMAGGTNVGKSQIFNALVGHAGAMPDARSAQTRHPLAYVHQRDLPALEAIMHGEWHIQPLQDPAALNADAPGHAWPLFTLTHSDDAIEGLCLFDTPDIDSDIASNRQKAIALAAICDALLFVTVTEKYNDRVCVNFLEQALREVRSMRVLFNLASSDNEAARLHLTRDVLPTLMATAGRAGHPAPPVTELPVVREPARRLATLMENLNPLRRDLLDDARRRLTAKRELVRHLGGMARESASRLSNHLAAEAAVLKSLDDSLLATRRAAQRRLTEFYATQPFHELDSVLMRILARLEVPVVDRSLDFAIGLLRQTGKAIGVINTEEQNRQEHNRTQTRADAEHAIAEEIMAAQWDLLRPLMDDDERAGRFRRELRQHLHDLRATPPPTLFKADGAASAQEDAFLAQLEEELTHKIEENPTLRKALIASRATFMAVGGGLAFVVPGGFLMHMIILPVFMGAARKLTELIGRQWITTRRTQFFEMRTNRALAELDAHHCAIRQTCRPTVEPALSEELKRAVDGFSSALDSALAHPTAPANTPTP